MTIFNSYVKLPEGIWYNEKNIYTGHPQTSNVTQESSIQYEDAVPLCAKEHERFCPTPPHPKWLLFLYVHRFRTQKLPKVLRLRVPMMPCVLKWWLKVCYQVMQKNVAKFWGDGSDGVLKWSCCQLFPLILREIVTDIGTKCLHHFVPHGCNVQYSEQHCVENCWHPRLAEILAYGAQSFFCKAVAWCSIPQKWHTVVDLHESILFLVQLDTEIAWWQRSLLRKMTIWQLKVTAQVISSRNNILMLISCAMEGTPRHAELHALKSTNIKEPYEIVHLCVYFWWFHLHAVCFCCMVDRGWEFGDLGIWERCHSYPRWRWIARRAALSIWLWRASRNNLDWQEGSGVQNQ